MKGAAADVDSTITRPRRSSAARIGSNHHFLCVLRKNQNSPTTFPPDSFAAAFSNSVCGALLMRLSSESRLPEISSDVTRHGLGCPVTGPVWLRPELQRIPPHQLEQPTDRREHQVKQQRQEDRGHNP